ncbi:MAG: cytidine deaminase, partial [Ruminococcus sp.]|nr:cytidine deaminase [Ruminococcus sp.]
AIIHASRDAMLGATLYLVGKDAKTGEYVENACACSMCKRMIINAGIKKIIIRNTKDKFTAIYVDEWIQNDESLDAVLGY